MLFTFFSSFLFLFLEVFCQLFSVTQIRNRFDNFGGTPKNGKPKNKNKYEKKEKKTKTKKIQKNRENILKKC
jgi:hypothetical protein